LMLSTHFLPWHAQTARSVGSCNKLAAWVLVLWRDNSVRKQEQRHHNYRLLICDGGEQPAFTSPPWRDTPNTGWGRPISLSTVLFLHMAAHDAYQSLPSESTWVYQSESIFTVHTFLLKLTYALPRQRYCSCCHWISLPHPNVNQQLPLLSGVWIVESGDLLPSICPSVLHVEAYFMWKRNICPSVCCMYPKQ
jgi:hypothetical protein